MRMVKVGVAVRRRVCCCCCRPCCCFEWCGQRQVAAEVAVAVVGWVDRSIFAAALSALSAAARRNLPLLCLGRGSCRRKGLRRL
jgi:hypothetical protein